MDFDSFMKLTDILRLFATPNPKSFRKDVISAKKRVTLGLYYLKDQGSLQMRVNAFGVSVSTVYLLGVLMGPMFPLFNLLTTHTTFFVTKSSIFTNSGHM